MAEGNPPSVWSRRLNLIYLVFFLVHIPVVLFVDLVPLYPKSLVPPFSASLRQFYIDTYRDRFFIQPPAWFSAYVVLEAVYHLPLSFWMIGALWRNEDPLLAIHLLIFALETGLTTLTCVVEMLSWDGYTADELKSLCGLYLPYLGVAVLMGTDSFIRVRKQLLGKVKRQ